MARKAKFTKELVESIRQAYKNGTEVKAIAVEMKVHPQTIYRVLQGKHPYEFESYEQGTLAFDSHGNAIETNVVE